MLMRPRSHSKYCCFQLSVLQIKSAHYRPWVCGKVIPKWRLTWGACFWVRASHFHGGYEGRENAKASQKSRVILRNLAIFAHLKVGNYNTYPNFERRKNLVSHLPAGFQWRSSLSYVTFCPLRSLIGFCLNNAWAWGKDFFCCKVPNHWWHWTYVSCQDAVPSNQKVW